MPEISIRYGETDADTLAIHRFLCLVAGPLLDAPIDAEDSVNEVDRVLHQDAAIMAEINGELVGSLGLIRAPFWYNRKALFLTNRWFFIFPQLQHAGVGARLLAEAGVIAANASLTIIIYRHTRKRDSGIAFTRPLTIEPHEVAGTDWERAERHVLR